jgi:hypothetical protein
MYSASRDSGYLHCGCGKVQSSVIEGALHVPQSTSALFVFTFLQTAIKELALKLKTKEKLSWDQNKDGYLTVLQFKVEVVKDMETEQ